MRFWSTITFILTLSTISLAQQVDSPPGTFTQRAITDALARYHNDWLTDVGWAFEGCDSLVELTQAVHNLKGFWEIEDVDEGQPGEDSDKPNEISTDTWTRMERRIALTAGTSLSREAELRYLGFARHLLKDWNPDKQYRKLSRDFPEEAARIDSATAVGCLLAAERSFGITHHELVSSERPYQLQLDSASLHDELLLYQLCPGERVADIGAGDGSVAHILAYLGLDVTPTELWYWHPTLERLHASMPAGIAQLYHPVKARHRNLGLSAGSFDVVLVRHTLHHLKRQEQALTQISQALRPGGRLLVIESYSDLHPESDSPCQDRETYTAQTTELQLAGFELIREVDIPDDQSLLTEWILAG